VKRGTRALIWAFAVLAIAVVAFGWLLVDYSAEHGVSPLRWLQDTRKANP
jgi:hypothetical protein